MKYDIFLLTLCTYLKEIGYDFKDYKDSKKSRNWFQCYCYLIKKVFNISTGSYELFSDGFRNIILDNIGYEIVYDIFSLTNENNIVKYMPSCLFNEKVQNNIKQIKNYIKNNLDELFLLDLYIVYDYLKTNYSLTDEKFKQNFVLISKRIFENNESNYNISSDQILIRLENLDNFLEKSKEDFFDEYRKG